jgi:hypothetical protein
MYLAHVAFRLSLTEVGELFGRDRTTVAHACGVIEDLRDDEIIDRALTVLAAALTPDFCIVRHRRYAGLRGLGNAETHGVVKT